MVRRVRAALHSASRDHGWNSSKARTARPQLLQPTSSGQLLGDVKICAMEGTMIVSPHGVTPRLLLRPWTEDDIPAMIAAYRDPEMRRQLRKPVTSIEQAREVIQSRRADREAGRAFSFAVVVPADAGLGFEADTAADTLAGSVVVRGLEQASPTAEVGYWVVAPARGLGIAPRALDAVCQWVFQLPRARPLQRLDLIHSTMNPSSCRVAEKAGFIMSAILPPLPPNFPHDGHLHVRFAS
jgi:RimJ/RimL family protein N-acetyltransferase